MTMNEDEKPSEAQSEQTGEAPAVEVAAPASEPDEPEAKVYELPSEAFKMLRAGFVAAAIASGRYNIGHADESAQALRDADAMLHKAMTEPFSAK